jgi:hypothetical protein
MSTLPRFRVPSPRFTKIQILHPGTRQFFRYHLCCSDSARDRNASINAGPPSLSSSKNNVLADGTQTVCRDYIDCLVAFAYNGSGPIDLLGR